VGKTPSEPEALRREIERTRTQLGETVEALAAKADVKARAQDAVDGAKARAHEAAEEVRERVHSAVDTLAYEVGKQRERVARVDPRIRVGLLALAALIAGLVALLIVRKARGSR
jgi:hypothetical protein